MGLSIAGSSAKGLRDVQQDRYACIRVGDKTFIVVADGNGGEGGEELAECCIKAVLAKLCYQVSQGKHKSFETAEALESLGIETVSNACELIMELKDIHGSEWADAGTTVTLLIITPGMIGTFWIGDSCAYLYKDGSLIKLTSPVHTLAELLIEQGESREIISRQPGLNSILTRCAGHEGLCEVSSRITEIDEKCIVVAGSDGVFNSLDEAELMEILKKGYEGCSDFQELTDEIVQASLDNGSDDNCTVTAALVQGGSRFQEQTCRLTRLYEWKV